MAAKKAATKKTRSQKVKDDFTKKKANLAKEEADAVQKALVTPEEDFERKRLAWLVSKYGEAGGNRRFEMEKAGKFSDKVLHA